MAFDYGSIDLGLRNPFKKEGLVTAVTGGLSACVGLAVLLIAAATVKENTVAGWIYIVFAVVLLGGGVRALSGGAFAMLRYFVGRNHPTSLAYNYSPSESSTAQEEARYVGYKGSTLEEMLIGRKNPTFVEPEGFLARALHSLLPKLLFMPYPIRNLGQRLFGAWVKTAVAIMAYLFVAFVTLAGFVGDMGTVIFPLYSVVLSVYVIVLWWRTGRAIARHPERQVESMGGSDLVMVIAVSIVLPVMVGLMLGSVSQVGNVGVQQWQQWISVLDGLYPLTYLLVSLLFAAVASVGIYQLLRRRLALANPVSEVSELRENWQESVHPNEIFINLDNLVMANRRYKEVPNRVYRELDPQLVEQVEGKGGFKGEMIQEIQPKVKPMDLGVSFDKVRMALLLGGNVLVLIATGLTLWLAFATVDLYEALAQQGVSVGALLSGDSSALSLPVNLLVWGVIFRAFAALLRGAAHLFFSEMQFESVMIYFKCEGTFTESKMSTGTGIHDSTRSENTLIRSSITPWIVVSRLVTSTFAATGMRNLEFPRYVMEMHKAPEALASIRADVVTFLKDRESIASITSERDLGNASQIYQLNQQTRAQASLPTAGADEDAAGYLRQEQAADEAEAKPGNGGTAGDEPVP
ncbi:hypothetical protein [Alcanivorax sp.]|mgnify:CR=1 FL=1|jgi:hypothetical protein|uniref:hypothetical protein n=1 Tax=Alcanivorax sp. TaxID=1872427 RepID=UPI0032D8DD6D